jgi:enoyl-CoA hydratase/carnithine racemase
MVITGRTYESSLLHDWGVVDRVLPGPELLARAREFAAELAAGPTAATGIAKQIITLARDRGVAAADAATPELAGPVLSSEDAAIGVEALLTHGPGAKPAFRGR